MSKQEQALHVSLRETRQKVESTLLPLIERHVSGGDDNGGTAAFRPDQGLDFLDAKNGLLLSYLIELVVRVRNQLVLAKKRRSAASTSPADVDDDAANRLHLCRLTEMKACLDRVRGLDKKLRYQIDKLLAAGTTAASFAAASSSASAGGGGALQTAAEEDPLQFRPNASALGDDDDDDNGDSSASESGDNDSENERSKEAAVVAEEEEEESEGGEGDDLDDDLAAARLTLSAAKGKARVAESSSSSLAAGRTSPGDGAAASEALYRAPRHAAVPYAHDDADREAEREKRRRRRMRASEVAQTLRSQYGEAPDREDIFGGSELGRQRQSSRRMTERRAEKTSYEEQSFTRLQTTRKERKESERVMRQENSNLAAIADLGSLVRETDDSGASRRSRGSRADDGPGTDDPPFGSSSDRYANGKRKRQALGRGGEGAAPRNKRPAAPRTNNPLQAALFGDSGTKSKKKKKKNKY